MKSEDVKIDIKAESPTHIIGSLTSSIDEKLSKLSAYPQNSDAACIFKVSKKLREANEAAYTPRFVSIGPLHHDVGHLQSMEAYKLRFLNNFMSRCGGGLNSLVEFAVENESFVRGCYEGTIKLSTKQLTEVILLDGIFIVELFLENHFFYLRDRNEIIFENYWMFNDLLHDMLLLENQLPMKIMKGLLEYVDHSFFNEGIELTIYDLAHKFFKDVGNTYKSPLTELCHNARHFVEFLLFLHAPRFPREKPNSVATRFDDTRSATELYHAGVKFKSGEGNCFFEFIFNKGVLAIPQLTVNDTTETFFWNLIAYERCRYLGYYPESIASYVILMNGFMHTPKDVDLLVDSRIINNQYHDSERLAELFNNLYKEVVTEATIFYFDKLHEDLNDYSRDIFHEMKARFFNWRVMVRHKYSLAAVVLLILTIIQTFCSIFQIVWA